VSKKILPLMPGLVAVAGDGAFRGKSIDAVQTETHAIVISPPRALQKALGGVRIGGKHYAVQPLTRTPTHDRVFARCPGHSLMAGGGAVLEAVVTADGTTTHSPLERGQVKQSRATDGRYSTRTQVRLPCRHDDGATVHQWWESLTPIKADQATGFNRGEYLLAIPRSHHTYERSYALRADAESLHSEFEHSWHRNRLPSWGAHRQMLAILGAVLAQNAWAAHRFENELARQHPPPDRAAA
jgi:hypothetical protein